MAMPGFTAEASLYGTSERHGLSRAQAGGADSLVVLAQRTLFGCGPCEQSIAGGWSRECCSFRPGVVEEPSCRKIPCQPPMYKPKYPPAWPGRWWPRLSG
jgi:hypothetical protein